MSHERSLLRQKTLSQKLIIICSRFWKFWYCERVYQIWRLWYSAILASSSCKSYIIACLKWEEFSPDFKTDYVSIKTRTIVHFSGVSGGFPVCWSSSTQVTSIFRNECEFIELEIESETYRQPEYSFCRAGQVPLVPSTCKENSIPSLILPFPFQSLYE